MNNIDVNNTVNVNGKLFLICDGSITEIESPKKVENVNKEEVKVGYLYCFSNECMPGLLKCGMTDRTPDERLKEANSSNTWKPPKSYKLEFAKKVNNPRDKEKALHYLLAKYTERPNPKREFFRITTEELLKFFDLIDGEMWMGK